MPVLDGHPPDIQLVRRAVPFERIRPMPEDFIERLGPPIVRASNSDNLWSNVPEPYLIEAFLQCSL